MRESIHCASCNTPLFGGIDTYGEQGHELCWLCFLTDRRLAEDDEPQGTEDDVYDGLLL